MDSPESPAQRVLFEEVANVEQVRRTWLAAAWALPRKVLVGAVRRVKKFYGWLKKRYGPRYTHALWIVTVIGFFSPIPGSSLAGIVLIVAVAEIHRAMANRFRSDAVVTREELIMTIHCDVIVQETATPGQLSALGSALWGWCNRAAGVTGAYQDLDNQVLADLIAGRLPGPNQTPRQSERRFDGVHFRVQDETSANRQAAIDSLRRDIPREGVVDIVVDGTSWKAGTLVDYSGLR